MASKLFPTCAGSNERVYLDEDGAPREPTPFEREIDDFEKNGLREIVAPVSFSDPGQYCGSCGARTYRCWCGSSRSLHRSER